MLELVVQERGMWESSWGSLGSISGVICILIVVILLLYLSILLVGEGIIESIATFLTLSSITFVMGLGLGIFMDKLLGVEGEGYYTGEVEVLYIGDANETVGDVNGENRVELVLGKDNYYINIKMDKDSADKVEVGDELEVRTDINKVYDFTKLEESIEDIQKTQNNVTNQWRLGVVIEDELY